jgi:GNAT superfamily N-acetyltransferase
MISNITFDTINEIWSKELWPDRKSPITPTSAMNYLNGYDLVNMQYEPSFIAYKLGGKIIGVNSGHMCMDGSYRSRGLFVYPEYRKQGIGVQLLLATIDQGKSESANFVWSYPRNTSWETYKKAGFVLTSDWEYSETGINAFCRIDL